MRRRIRIFSVLFCCIVMPGLAAMPDRFINNTMFKNPAPQTINKSISNVQSASGTKSNANSSGHVGKRRVVQRKNVARSATTNQQTVKPAQQRRVVQRPNTARAAATNKMNTRTIAQPRTNSPRVANNTNRKVVARSSKRSNAVIRSATERQTTNITSGSVISSQRCFSSYKECMEDYCERKDTAYNRCFCSAKLAQIDSRYQDKIDSLIKQIIKLQYNNRDNEQTSEEIKAYWDKTIGSYTGTNPWVNIDNALNIKWADAESRVRGQNAFNIGHQYCVNFLAACSSMATNMRDAYKSEITRDCATYESSLQKIQAAAESVIESYND